MTTGWAFAVALVAGFVIMAPVGPVSTLCIRRALLAGPLPGIAAGAGDALAVAVYGTLGAVSGARLLERVPLSAPAWHAGAAAVLALVGVVLWRAPAASRTDARGARMASLGGFLAALVLALMNPADIVVFGALFTAAGVHATGALAAGAVFAGLLAGGALYWTVVSLALGLRRLRLQPLHLQRLNRLCAALMFAAALASLLTRSRT